jgi:hypothetical protein
MDEQRKTEYCLKRIKQLRKQNATDFEIIQTVGVVVGEKFVQRMLESVDSKKN